LSKDNPIVPESDGRRKGFAGPNYTQVPNDIMDRWLADLSGAETKVLLYLARRTFGFHRDRVKVGLRTICKGIPGKDRGTGLHIETTSQAVKGLEARGLVLPKRPPGGRTTYTLPVANVYGKSAQARSENPNSRVFGKSVHEERKSSSERNGKKQRRGGTLEQTRAQTPAATPEPPTKPKNTSMKADDEEPKPKQRPACDETPRTNSEKTKGTTTGNPVIDFTARLAARHGPAWNTKETIRVCKEELDRYDVPLKDFVEWEPSKTGSPGKVRSDAYYRSIARQFARERGSLGALDTTFTQLEQVRAGLAELETRPVVERCEHCKCEKGKGTVLVEDHVEACPACATDEWRNRVDAANARDKTPRNEKVKTPSSNPDAPARCCALGKKSSGEYCDCPMGRRLA
jgi:hypothetical protein